MCLQYSNFGHCMQNIFFPLFFCVCLRSSSLRSSSFVGLKSTPHTLLTGAKCRYELAFMESDGNGERTSYTQTNGSIRCAWNRSGRFKVQEKCYAKNMQNFRWYEFRLWCPFSALYSPWNPKRQIGQIFLAQAWSIIDRQWHLEDCRPLPKLVLYISLPGGSILKPFDKMST